LLIKYLNIGYDWKFKEQQKELFQKYYEVNKLLVYFLNNAADVSLTVARKLRMNYY